MGSAGSKPDRNEVLSLCKERMRYIKHAIDSRYALSAAHLCYVQSLRDVGIALRRFAEADILNESSLSTSEPDKSPSHSSYASPSPSRFPEHVSSPSHSVSPFSPRLSNMSYMRAARSASVTLTIDTSSNHFVDDESLTFPPPPPPPPLPEAGASWDFFDPADVMHNMRFMNGENSPSPNYNRMMGLRQFKEDEVVPLIEDEVDYSLKEKGLCKGDKNGNIGGKTMTANTFSYATSSAISTVFEKTEISADKELKNELTNADGPVEVLARIASSELCIPKGGKGELEKDICTEREDASEFITHRAKDFLSSIKDIEHRFVRAAESGNEVSRMLETNKIRVGMSCTITGKSSASVLLSAFHLACCQNSYPPEHESTQHVTKVITWNRSISSRSSSSKHPLTAASKDDNCESGSDFIEEFCMISGSHSSTLDRLYAWEIKLYDEVKASEAIRKVYDQKCTQLRHQFARDMSAQVIDKTRATVKDLHSRLRVAIQAVDSISKRIEKLRDEELQPQLVELIQGLIRMWKAMLECHHAQYITISLAYHVKSSATAPHGESHKQALTHLQSEMECFNSSFANWVDAHKSYVESLNTWLQKCILQPQERSRGRRVPFSPRRVIAPPIFVLCRDWFTGVNNPLPSDELRDSIKALLSELHKSFEQHLETKQTEQKLIDSNNGGEAEEKENKEDDGKSERISNLGSLQTCLTRMFDRLTKFSEASLKMYEEVKQGTEMARVAYTNCRFRS